MQQREFKHVVRQSLPKLKRLLGKSTIGYDDCQDILATVLDRAYRKKAYTRLSKAKAFSYLESRTRFAAQEFLQADKEKNKRECLLPEDSDSPLIRFVESHSPPMEECPFCFNESLNDLGTCSLCHTACPSYAVLHRGSVAIEEVSLSLDVDLLKQADINIALESLSPMEQKVVKACIMGNESLESFAQIEAMNRKTLWRIWVKAREKLMQKLADYA